jgi:hypothetical protein
MPCGFPNMPGMKDLPPEALENPEEFLKKMGKKFPGGFPGGKFPF